MTGGALVTPEVAAMVGTTATYRAPEPIDAGAIRYFALAIGGDPGRWADEAPPTLVCETNQLTGNGEADDDGYLGHTWSLPFAEPVDMIRGGNDYRFHRPMRPGDRIMTTWSLTSITERGTGPSGRLAVVTARGDYTSIDDGEPIATNTETLLYRPRPSAAVPPAATTRAAGPGSGPAAADTPTAGEPLPSLERQLDLVDLVAYGAATWDWHRLHYDPVHAAAAGLAAPVVDGQLFGALLAEQVDRWLGNAGRLVRLHYRNRAPVHPGTVVRCVGHVADRTGDGCVLALRVMADGVPVVDPAGAEVAFTGPPGG